MKTIAIVTLALLVALCAQGQTVKPGTDILLGTGVSYSSVLQQSSSLTSFSVRIASIAGRATYATTEFETSWASIRSGNVSGSLSTKAGITQVLWAPSQNVYLWCNTVGGVTKFDLASLSSFSGAVGLAWDAGARFTKGKYHIYVVPLVREISIAGMQVKPAYGIQILSGFSRGQ